MILILGLTTWAHGARIIRAQVLSLRNRDYVLSAWAMGESRDRILAVEIIPNMVSLIFTWTSGRGRPASR
jgi:peptide/nickel transport system permease protein